MTFQRSCNRSSGSSYRGSRKRKSDGPSEITSPKSVKLHKISKLCTYHTMCKSMYNELGTLRKQVNDLLIPKKKPKHKTRRSVRGMTPNGIVQMCAKNPDRDKIMREVLYWIAISDGLILKGIKTGKNNNLNETHGDSEVVDQKQQLREHFFGTKRKDNRNDNEKNDLMAEEQAKDEKSPISEQKRQIFSEHEANTLEWLIEMTQRGYKLQDLVSGQKKLRQTKTWQEDEEKRLEEGLRFMNEYYEGNTANLNFFGIENDNYFAENDREIMKFDTENEFRVRKFKFLSKIVRTRTNKQIRDKLENRKGQNWKW